LSVARVISGGTYGRGVRHYGGEVKMGKVSGQVTLNEGPHLGDLRIWANIIKVDFNETGIKRVACVAAWKG
jgi:hypothetical protein